MTTDLHNVRLTVISFSPKGFRSGHSIAMTTTKTTTGGECYGKEENVEIELRKDTFAFGNSCKVISRERRRIDNFT